MKDYILLPIILNSIDGLMEGRLKSFLSQCKKVDSHRYALDSLREMYLKNKTEFILMVDELSLRGFSFYTEKPNNILPSGTVSVARHIWAEEDQGRFRKLDYQNLGMSGFIQRFHIESDQFFHNVPLAGFKRINSHLDTNLLEAELLKAGFAIRDLETGQIIEAKSAYISKPNKDPGQMERHDPETGQTTVLVHSDGKDPVIGTVQLKETGKPSHLTEFNQQKTEIGTTSISLKENQKEPSGQSTTNSLPAGNSTSSDQVGHSSQTHVSPPSESEYEPVNISIKEAFPEGSFWQFHAFCSRKGIKDISELTTELLEEHSMRRGVSPAKVKVIKLRLHKLLNPNEENQIEPEGYKETVLSGDSIEFVFADNIFRTFREFCKEHEIQSIYQLNEKLIEKYSYLPGVGVGKILTVKRKVDDVLLAKSPSEAGEHEERPASDTGVQNLVDDVFHEFRFWTFRNYCKKKGIKTIQELNARHFHEYSAEKGVGVGKVRAVKELANQYIRIGRVSVSETKAQLLKVTIDEVFSDNLFRSFRRFCELNSIVTVYDVTSEHLAEYGKGRGVGVGRVEMVQKRLNHIRTLQEKPPVSLQAGGEQLAVSLNAAHLEIKTLFAEGKYQLFRSFCEKKGIETIGDIKTLDLDEFAKQPMVGRKKVEEVRHTLSFYSDSVESAPQVFESGEVFDSIKELEVQALLYLYSFQSHSQSKLKVKDIEGKDLASLKDEFEPHLLQSLSGLLIKQKSPKGIADSLKTVVSERDYEILFHRFGKGETLEEVGSQFGVTRERIRQVAKKTVKKVAGHIRRQHFSKIVRVLSSSEAFISGEELLKLLGEENQFLISLLKQENLIFNYYKNLDLFFFDEAGKVNLKPVEELIEDLPEVFNFNEYQQSLEEAFESVGIENPATEFIQQIIENKRYIKYGEVYSRYRLPINEVLTYLFKQYVDKPLRIDEDGVAYLQKLAKEHLEYDLGSTVRSVDARIRDAENILLVDRSTFAHFDSETFDNTIISEIETYINGQFLIKDVINVEDVFAQFRNKLESMNIHNKLHLYSLIRYYLDEKYTIGQGNTLNIFKNETSKLSLEDRLVAYMKSKGGLCSKEQLLDVIRPQYKVDLAISHSDKIIPWGNNHAILIDNLKLQSAEKSQLVGYFKKAFKNGFSTAQFMYKEMMFDRKLSSLLRNKGIDEAAKLPALVKLFLPNIKGHTNFLYLEDGEIDSFEQVIEAQFPGETSRQEIKDFTLEYGYKEMMAATFLKRLLDQATYVEVDVDQLYPGKRLKISDDSLAQIKAFAEEAQGDQAFLSVSSLKGYRRKLPPIGFRWNPYLLNSILHRCGYRQIKKFVNDYRYDMIIVVKENSPIQTFEDLVVHLLETEYEGNMHEYGIYDFLTEKGILREQEYIYKKILPKELKTSEKLSFDELGYAALRQGT